MSESNEYMNDLEAILLDKYCGDLEVKELTPVFILGAPRTGSTLFYQLTLNCFSFRYFSNFVNTHFAQTPCVGMFLDNLLNPGHEHSYQSSYGKTEGAFGASEGSFVMKNWFGGEHPSETRSNKIIADKKDHMIRSIAAITRMTGQPVLIKNAWNCFRVAELSDIFPSASFLWVRRNVVESAASDLASRRAMGGAETWNSATPANVEKIQKLPYWEQVVEQQYEFNRAISDALHSCAPDRFIDIKYDELCKAPDVQVDRIEDLLERNNVYADRKSHVPMPFQQSGRHSSNEDYKKIREYVQENKQRLGRYVLV